MNGVLGDRVGRSTDVCYLFPMPAAIDPSDLIGRQFGTLIVKEFVKVETYTYGQGRKRLDYTYRCDCTCGRTGIEALRVHLLTGHKKSCGCQWKPLGGKNWRWTGYQEISGGLWSKIRFNARSRKLTFDITIEDIWQKFLEQERRCALTGLELVFSRSVEEEINGVRTASLDRIDSSKGYTRDNIQWVHKDINQMKMDLPLERFVELCRAVALRVTPERASSRGRGG